jgi:hypothetical protein
VAPALVARRMVAAPRRSLVAALALARHSALAHSVAAHLVLAASAHRCMHVLPKVVVQVVRKASVRHRAAMMNTVDQKHAGLNIVVLVVHRHAVPKVVAMIAGPKAAAPMLVRRHMVRKEEAQDVDRNTADRNIAVQKHAAPNIVVLVARRHAVLKAAVKIAVPKVVAQTPDRHVVLKDVAPKVAGQKVVAMMIVDPKVAAPVAHRRVAKAQVVEKVAVVHRHPAMTMSRFSFGTHLAPSS